MIHPPQPGSDGYSISSRHVWLPGIYDSEKTARVAFFFQDHVLSRLQDDINAKQRRNITLSDLRAERPHGLRKSK